MPLASNPSTTKELSNYMIKERMQVIQTLAHKSQTLGHPPDKSGKEEGLYLRLDALLDRLASVHMTPDLKQATKINLGLRIIFEYPNYHFLPAYVDKGKTLYERWEAGQWGEVQDVKMEDIKAEDIKVEDSDQRLADKSSGPSRRKDSATPRSSSGSVSPINRGTTAWNDKITIQPPSTDPIWGLRGIMHGTARTVSRNADGKKVFSVVGNSSRLRPRSGKVFGHNGLEVGAWYARRLNALIHGAHGESQAGICGDENGAFSIVVADAYADLDRDEGDHLFYSGSRSHVNEDPNQPPPPTRGTRALHESLRTGKAVRVIRASTGDAKVAPTFGYRYDGLYRVVRVTHPKNAKGGRYEQFGLMRLGEQAPIDRTRPTPREVKDYQRISDGYPGAR